MIKVDNLSFSYGNKKILDNVQFSINKKEFVSIIGHNGSGKTTLLKLLTGLLKPEEGRVIFSQQQTSIGYINQESIQTNLPISVSEVVGIGTIPKNHQKPAMDPLKLLKIEDLKNSLYRELSGGQKQKVNIARALMQNPQILLLDEPSNFLDNDSQEEIMNIIKMLNDDYGITIIIISHNMDLVKKYSDQILLLQNKKISIFTEKD